MSTRVEEVLVVDDEDNVRAGLRDALQGAGFRVSEVASLAAARALLGAEHTFACMLLDLRLGDGDGLDLLEELQGTAHAPPVIVATAYGDSERTIRAMRGGAFDYLTKPFDLSALLAAVARATRATQVRAEASARGGLRVPRDAPSAGRRTLIGNSSSMLEVWKDIGRASACEAPVLITGETGTGKEVVARAIHEHSPRGGGPFVAVNLAGLPASLLEAELFGQEKGAFTGAVRARQGRFARAAGGTLFLDEIGDLEPSLQTKLLRVLQEGTYERVGSSEPHETDVRIVAATHRNVRPSDEATTLRPDLYYRLAVIEVALPPLRERVSDIPLLVQHALRETSVEAVTEGVMRHLAAAPWPGNVRQLLHVVQRAAVMSATEVIDEDCLPSEIRELGVRAEGTSSGSSWEGMTLPEAVAALEREMIAHALEVAEGNRSQAARVLGIGRQQLYAKLAQHGVEAKK